MEILTTCIIIFCARLCDVSLGTIRMLFVMKGKRVYSFIASFLEVMIWLFVARKVLSSDELNIYSMVAYALGYATGTVLGSWLETLLAMGYTTVEIIINKSEYNVVEEIRNHGFAVSLIDCKGSESSHWLLFMQVERKSVPHLIGITKSLAPNAFITTTDTRSILNGHFARHGK